MQCKALWIVLVDEYKEDAGRELGKTEKGCFLALILTVLNIWHSHSLQNMSLSMDVALDLLLSQESNDCVLLG